MSKHIKTKFLFLGICCGISLLFGCVGNRPPVADFSAYPTEGPAPLLVLFRALAYDPDGDIVRYAWEFGDGNAQESESVVSHTYRQPGVYQARLTVTDDKGAKGIKTKAITVTPSALQILGWELKKDMFFAFVEGQARNVSGRTLAYAEVRAYFYNAARERIGEFFANVTTLRPGEMWRFKVLYLGNKDDVALAEVEVGHCMFD